MPALEQDYLCLTASSPLGSHSSGMCWQISVLGVHQGVVCSSEQQMHPSPQVHKFLLQGRIAAKFKGYTDKALQTSASCVWMRERSKTDRSYTLFSRILLTDDSAIFILRAQCCSSDWRRLLFALVVKLLPDPTILWLTEFPYSLTLAGQDEQLPPSYL